MYLNVTPAPLIHPPLHAMPSIKLAFNLLPFFFNKAILHCSIPLHISGLKSKLMLFSKRPSLIAFATPPVLANSRPYSEALIILSSLQLFSSISLESNKACNSEYVNTTSIYSLTFDSFLSAFFAVHGPIKITLEFGFFFCNL